MTPAPRFDVLVNVYLPGMFLSLGSVQAQPYWANPAAVQPLRWQPQGVKATKWGAPPPPPAADWS
jgi:hypothetical protein